MERDSVKRIRPLGFAWEAADPFLFCVHHDDRYPAGNDALGPAASLAGRDLGQDFEGRDGWRMYHGITVPGFPQHPHRGFETVTLVRRGFIDHSDSLGAAARFGGGDVQWLTAGGGVVHSEMFPLLNSDRPNPLELFQIWLNLPRADKLVAAHFSMLWAESIPRRMFRDSEGRTTEVTAVAGRIEGAEDSSATAKVVGRAAGFGPRHLDDQARRRVRGGRSRVSAPGTNRTLYFFRGATLRIGGQAIPPRHAAELRPEIEVPLENGPEESELLLLQGRPIGEPVAQQGPFVMTSRAEIEQAFADYQRTRFGGWPWPKDDPVHPRSEGRFARHADGRIERPGGD